MKMIRFKNFLSFIIMITVLIVFFNCNTPLNDSSSEDNKPGPGSDFFVVTNSGNVIVRLLNANTDHSGVKFASSAETPYSPSSRVDNSDIISNDIMSLQLEDANNDIMTFHGGAVLEVCCFIDTDGNGPISDGDYLAFKTITINGNTTVDFNY